MEAIGSVSFCSVLLVFALQAFNLISTNVFLILLFITTPALIFANTYFHRSNIIKFIKQYKAKTIDWSAFFLATATGTTVIGLVIMLLSPVHIPIIVSNLFLLAFLAGNIEHIRATLNNMETRNLKHLINSLLGTVMVLCSFHALHLVNLSQTTSGIVLLLTITSNMLILAPAVIKKALE